MTDCVLVWSKRGRFWGADESLLKCGHFDVQVLSSDPMWSDAVINHTPLGSGNKNSSVICVKASKLGGKMQSIYTMATLCKRPSDVGTKHANKCYPLYPGQTSFGVWYLPLKPATEGNIYIHYVPKKVSPLMFDNKFGKCGPIFKIFSPVDS